MQKSHKRGVITFAFDDGYLDTYKHAISFLDSLGIKSTLAIPFNAIGKTLEKRPVIGPKELKNLSRSGHEIAAHTITHPNLLKTYSKDKGAASSEIIDSKRKLKSILDCKVPSFVFPYIKKNHSRALRLITERYFKSSRVTTDRPSFNKLPIKDPHSISGFAVTRKHSPVYLNKQIDHAAKHKLWLIEVFHLVGRKNTLSAHRPKPYRYFMHIDDFKKHVNYILKKDITIVTQKNGL